MCSAVVVVRLTVTFTASTGESWRLLDALRCLTVPTRQERGCLGVPIEGAQHPDQIVEQQLKMALDAQLAAKGLKKTEGDPADLYVGYQVAVNQERQWNAYGGGGVGWRMGGGMGTATKTLDARASPQKRQENINKAATKLLKNFPPPVKK